MPVAFSVRIGGEMMVGEDHAVRVQASAAEAVEQELSRRSLCNWLVDYSEADRVYCGRPAHGGLCSDHAGTFGVPI